MYIISCSCFFYLNQLILTVSPQSLVQENNAHSKERNGAYESMKIINDHCFNQITESFVLIGDWSLEDTFLLKAVQANSQSLYLLDGKNNDLQKYKRFSPFTRINETVVGTKVYLASNVTIVVSPTSALTNLLNDLRDSIWWNHEAHFLIINKAYENGCNFARQFLNILWNFNILTAIYLCIDNESVFMFTFNLYDRTETAFWKIAWINSTADNYWTMLQHSFNKSINVQDVMLNCNDMKLERIKNLNRLNINIGARKSKWKIQLDSAIREIADDSMIFHAILNNLNATYTFKTYSQVGIITKSGPTDFLEDIQTGSLKVLTCLLFARNFWRIQAYSHDFDGLTIVIPKYSDEQSLTGFIAKDWPFHVAIVLVSIIVVKYVFDYSLSRTLLEFVRMLTAGYVRGKGTRSRYYFILFCISLAISMVSVFLSSHLTAYKTVPGSGQRINSMDDLVKSNLTVIGTVYHRELLYRAPILIRFESNEEFNCLREISDGQTKACITYRAEYKASNYSLYLHEVREFLCVRPTSFTFTVDWPLFSKFNRMLSYMAEAGVYQFLSAMYQATKWKWSKERHPAQALSLKEFKFGFYMLYVGWTLAFCAFVFEIFAHKLKSLKCK